MSGGAKRPKVTNQGKCIVEESAGEYTIMFPDGACEVTTTRADAERRCKRWFKRHADAGAVNVGTIEWTQARRG